MVSVLYLKAFQKRMGKLLVGICENISHRLLNKTAYKFLKPAYGEHMFAVDFVC